MSAYIERARNRFRVRVFSNGTRRTLEVVDTREEAERLVEAYNASVARGRIVEPEGATVREIVDAWMVRRAATGRVRSMDAEWYVVRGRLYGHPIELVAVQSLRPVDVEDWIECLCERLARDSVRHALRLLRGALDDAVRREIIHANPASVVRVPRNDTAAAEDAWTYLTADELALLFGAELTTRERAIFATAVYAGLRRGELFALQWRDVELEGERPHAWIRRGHRGAPKSGKARRVPLLGPVVEALGAWRGELTLVRPDGLVFPGEGGAMHSRSYTAGWEDKRDRRGGSRVVVTPGLRSRVGIARAVRFHDLRHTCASHLVMGTWGRAWRLEEVREMLGHSTVRLTERYAHLAPGLLDAAAAATLATSSTTSTSSSSAAAPPSTSSPSTAASSPIATDGAPSNGSSSTGASTSTSSPAGASEGASSGARGELDEGAAVAHGLPTGSKGSAAKSAESLGRWSRIRTDDIRLVRAALYR